MPTRYFTYRYSGSRQQIGSHGDVYWFAQNSVTPVNNNDDAEWFLHMGSPENGIYYFRETDALGNPIGLFPPITPELRQSFLNTKRFPTDQGVPNWPEWRLITETMGDPTMYYHYIRKKLRRG